MVNEVDMWDGPVSRFFRADNAPIGTNEIQAVAAIFQKDRTLAGVFAGLKVMMAALGFCTPHVLPPLIPVKSDEAGRLVAEMKRVGIL